MKTKQTFTQWKRQFELILLETYGVTVDDCTDEERMKLEFENGASPQSLVDFLGEKYAMSKMNEF